jgi:2-phosphosulfolactate phosphatase
MTLAPARRASIAGAAQRQASSSTSARTRETVLIVCSGSGNNFNFEDFYGAGYFVERCCASAERIFRRGAKAAHAVSGSRRRGAARLPPRPAMMCARGLRHEVEFACRRDAFPVVPALEQGRLRLIA